MDKIIIKPITFFPISSGASAYPPQLEDSRCRYDIGVVYKVIFCGAETISIEASRLISSFYSITKNDIENAIGIARRLINSEVCSEKITNFWKSNDAIAISFNHMNLAIHKADTIFDSQGCLVILQNHQALFDRILHLIGEEYEIVIQNF